MSEVEATIIDALCQKKAESAYVYVNPTDISGYEFWQDYPYVGRDKAVEDCWYWQLGYWVIEDVLDTIDVLNSGSRRVLNSPVKRLMGLNFSVSDRRARERSRTTDEDRPYYVFSLEDGLCEPWTRSFSSDDL